MLQCPFINIDTLIHYTSMRGLVSLNHDEDHAKEYIRVRTSSHLNFPIRLFQGLRIRFYVGIAREDWIVFAAFVRYVEHFRQRRTFPRETIPAHCPAEGQIEYDAHVLEMIRGTPSTISDGKVRVGCAPRVRIRHDPIGRILQSRCIDRIAQILRYARAEYPRFDIPPHPIWSLSISTDGIPFQDVYAAAVRVDGLAQRIIAFVNDGASLVLPLMGRHRPAVVGALDRLVVRIAREVVRNAGFFFSCEGWTMMIFFVRFRACILDGTPSCRMPNAKGGDWGVNPKKITHLSFPNGQSLHMGQLARTCRIDRRYEGPSWRSFVH